MHTLNTIEKARLAFERTLGKYGKFAMDASIKKKSTIKKECYSATMISAISYDRIIAN